MSLGILIVSDTCAQDPSQDALAQVLARELGDFASPAVAYAPDDVTRIQQAVRELARTCTLVVTAGGTGLAPRDVTPEAVGPLLERLAPGLVVAMLSAGLRDTPFAALSRPVAGVLGSTLIVTVPGSPKAARQSAAALSPLLPHALQLLAGESSRSLHAGTQTGSVSPATPHAVHTHPPTPPPAETGAPSTHKALGEPGPATAPAAADLAAVSAAASAAALAATAAAAPGAPAADASGHPSAKPSADVSPEGPVPLASIPRASLAPAHHNHSRSHSGPRFYGSANRPRHSPYPMISYEEALASVLANTPAPRAVTIPLNDSLSHVLAEDLFSPLNVPPFRASLVDGYAVTHSDCPGTLPVSKVLVASSDLAIFTRSTCVRITTGAPVPHGATAVVPVENTVVAEEIDGEETKITIDATDVRSGDNIRKIGSDLALGSLVLPKGTLISAVGGEVGTLASTGLFCVPVFSKPTVGVLSTGNELVNVDGTCYGSQIWDSNRPMLLTALRHRHIPCIDLGMVRDDREELERVLKEALEKVDILVTTGGVSMGELDLIKPTIEGLGGTLHFGRVAIKPGKPMTFATIGSKLIFALPGNPASAAVCLNLFVLPCVDKWSGVDPTATHVRARLQSAVELDSRAEFHRAFVRATDAGWEASSTGFQRSSRVKSLAGANALLCLPPKTNDRARVEAGELVDIILLST